MSNKSIQFHNGKCMIARLAPTSPVSRLVTICCSLFAICLLLGTVPNSDAATWYTNTYLEFDKGAFDQTAIRSTSTTAFIELGRQGAAELSPDDIELGRQGAAELSPDDKTVGLYHMNDGGASELSNSVHGSTVVALYHFNDPPAPLSADANTVALWHFNNGDGYYALDSSTQVWSKRIPITISTDTDHSVPDDYQVWIPTTVFTQTQWDDIKGGTGQDDLDDVRFATGTLSTARFFPYWIDPDTDNPTGFWVKVPHIPSAGSLVIYLYYGNASAGTGYSGDNTFKMFEQFKGTSLNTDVWTTDISGDGTVSVSGDSCDVYVPKLINKYTVLRSVKGFGCGYILEGRASIDYGGYSIYGFFGFESNGTQAYSKTNAISFLDNSSGASGENIDMALLSKKDSVEGGTSLSGAGGENVWREYKLVRENTQIKWYVDGDLKHTLTDTSKIPTTNLPIAFGGDTASSYSPTSSEHHYLDWVRVRKYAAGEPTTSAGTTETSGYQLGVNNGYIVRSTAQWTSDGMFGGGMSFNGVDEYVDCGSNVFLDDLPAGEVTWEAWFKPDWNTDGYKYILSKRNDGTDGYAICPNIGGDKVYVAIQYSDTAIMKSFDVMLEQNHWYYIAVTFDGTGDKKAILYLNGIYQGISSAASGSYDTDVTANQLIGTTSGLDPKFLGLIDEVRISNVARSAQTICEDAGGLVDSSGLGNHGGLNIATQTYVSSMSGFSNCLEFNGSCDYVEISTASGSFDITDAITLEAWVNIKEVATSQEIIFDKRTATDSGYNMLVWQTGEPYFSINNSGFATSPDDLTPGWHHLVGTYDKKLGSANLELFVDGTQKAQGDYTTSIGGIGGTAVIGARYSKNQSYFNGKIDEVRISSGALTAEQIATDAGCMIQDTSGHDNWAVAVSTAGTSAGLSIWTDSGKFGKATTYDGTNDCVEISTTATLNFAGDASWESWIKTSDSGEASVVSKYKDSDNHYNIRIDGGVAKSSAVISAGSVWNITGSETVNDNTFHHVAVTRADNDTAVLYIDGVSDGTSSDSGADISLGGGKLYLGRSGNSADEDWFNGTIDEVRISSTAYSGNQIRYDALGACYTSGAYLSDVKDTGANGTVYSNIYASTEAATSATLKFYVKSSSCTSPYVWTGWLGPYDPGDSLAGVTRYRYCQYKATFTTTNTIYSALMNDCTIQYSLNTAESPSLTSPDSSWNDSTPVFDWEFGDNENDTQTAYQIQLSTDIDFSVVNYSTGPYSSVYSSMTWPSANPIDDGIYWWQCKTRDSYDKWSVWSSTYQVKVDTIAPVGMTISWIRADNKNQITIEGTGTDAGVGLHADAWWFEETTGNPGATSSSVWESTSVYTDSGLSRNTQYTYRVKLRDNLGNESGWSTAINKKTLPCVWQEKTTTRTGPNAFGFDGDGVWTWEVPANGGSLLTITAYVQYNSSYGAAAKPKFTLSNYGIDDSAQASGAAEDNWEKLTVSGTPSGKGVLFLKVEGFSKAVGAKYFVDDIQVNQ